MVGVDSGSQYMQADSQPKSSGLVLGRRPLGAVLHSSNEPGELSQWLCSDDSTINMVLDIIILLLLNPILKTDWLPNWPYIIGLYMLGLSVGDAVDKNLHVSKHNNYRYRNNLQSSTSYRSWQLLHRITNLIVFSVSDHCIISDISRP